MKTDEEETSWILGRNWECPGNYLGDIHLGSTPKLGSLNWGMNLGGPSESLAPDGKAGDRTKLWSSLVP